MRKILALAILVFICAMGTARATVSVDIDLSHQRMHVVSAQGSYDWAISSARSGFYTPGGRYAPVRLERMHYSRKYHMSPMPYSIFFRGGYAIHGTYETRHLGRPASHGCIRLAPANAALLYGMVRQEGALISISGHPPATKYAAGTRHHRHHGAASMMARAPAPVANPSMQSSGWDFFETAN